ncbi:unnamed protein product [Rhodiola kirilowii]
MAAISHQDSKRLYSWLWDSHISPRNSKWLQENLADMDSTVKLMIKIIEEDGDSFARRAEMYYKRRPELMRLVEQFYRAYRGLAERYSHATGVIRQAHHTMAEAFPDQVPPLLTEESTTRVVAERSGSDMTLFRADKMSRLNSCTVDEMKISGVREGAESVMNGKGLKRVSLFGSFAEEMEKDTTFGSNNTLDVMECEGEINSVINSLLLKEYVSNLEAEKETGLVHFQMILEKLSVLESRLNCAEEEFRRLKEKASKAGAEVYLLNEALRRSEGEKEALVTQHKNCVERISTLEAELSHLSRDTGELHEPAGKAETQVQTLKDVLVSAEAENDTILAQHSQCAVIISSLQKKFVNAENDARRISKRACEAEDEVENLKKEIGKLEEEKEVSSLVYWQSINKISCLEREFSSTKEDVPRLNEEISSAAFKLQGAEERNLSLERSKDYLQSEMQSLVQEMECQRRQLLEKQAELGRVWTRVQEEHSRYMEAETALQKLQLLHSKSREKLGSVTLQLHSKEESLKVLEVRNKSLELKILKTKEAVENRDLQNLSSELSMEYFQSENKELRVKIGKLDEEIEVRVSQRNALQHEICGLRREIKSLHEKYDLMLGEMVLVSLDSECFSQFVRELRDENIKLNDVCQRERDEKKVLLEKLERMEKLLEEKAVLQKSIFDLNGIFEEVKAEMLSFEESSQLVADEKLTLEIEKAVLLFLAEGVTYDADQLSRKNANLERSLIDANSELHKLMQKSIRLESSFQSLDQEKNELSLQMEVLVSQCETLRETNDELQKKHEETECKNYTLEKEKDSSLSRVKELLYSIDLIKLDRSDLTEAYEARVARLESQLCILKEDKQKMEKENEEEEAVRAFMAEIGIFVFQKVIEDLKGKNASLVDEVEQLVLSAKLAEHVISELEHKIVVGAAQVTDLLGQVETLRVGMNQVSRTLSFNADAESEDESVSDDTRVKLLLQKVEILKQKRRQTLDHNELLALEKSVLVMLFGQLRIEAVEADKERNALLENLNRESQKLVALQIEAENLLKMNDKLKNDFEVLNLSFSELQDSYQNLQTRNEKLMQENISLKKDFLELKQKNRALEDENCMVLVEALSLSNISFVFKNFVTEKTTKVAELSARLHNLDGVNIELEKSVKRLEGDLEIVRAENMLLNVSVQELDKELHEVEQNLVDTRKEKSLLDNKLEVLKRDYSKVQESQDEQIIKLSRGISVLHKKVKQLEAQLLALREQCEETKGRERDMISELENGRNETELRKTESDALLSNLLIFSVEEVVFIEKVRELTEKCRSLDKQRITEGGNVKLLKERAGCLEGETVGLKAQLDTFTAAIDSLRDSLLSLESHAFLREKLLKNAEVSKDNGPKSESELFGGLAKVQEMQTMIKAVQEVMVDMESFGAPENLDSEIKCEVPREELRSQCARDDHSVGSIKDLTSQQFDAAMQMDRPGHDLRIKKGITDPSYVDLDTPKDITLDQTSKHERYGSSRTDDRMLELWEIGSEGQSIDLTVGKGQKANHISEIMAVNEELEVVDKMEVSKRFIDSYQEENKRKMLEKLESDGLKLTNLQITVQDLKTKVEITEKTKKKDHDIEYNTVKEQLEEAEEAITKLSKMNAKLKKAVQDNDQITSNGKSQTEFEQVWSLRRRKILDHAQRGAERLARLQLEVQKLQFLLLKLDSEKEKKPRTRHTDSGPKYLLKDYLHSRGRSVKLSSQNQSKKKRFCGCINPPTMGD